MTANCLGVPVQVLNGNFCIYFNPVQFYNESSTFMDEYEGLLMKIT